MSPRRRARRDRDERGEEPTEDGFSAGEFEEFEVTANLPPEEAGEFEEVDLDVAAPAARAPIEDLLAAKAQLEQQLLVDHTEEALAAESGTDEYGFENIVGVGVSEKRIDRQDTGQPCVTVFVVGKAPRSEVASAALVPEEVSGYPTDVVQTGELLALPHRGRYRPAPNGVSVGHFRITAGTLGCLVRRGSQLFILSNNHVLANSNGANIGDPILQPGPADGGRIPGDVIARLSQFVPIQFGGAANQVDCAIAQTSPGLVSPLNKCLGRISASPVLARLNLLVKKCGRTTQFTQGRVIAIAATARIRFGNQIALFRNQMFIESFTLSPFSAGGDSGSLIVTLDGNRPVGLLFAGGPSHTIANPIGDVLTTLNVSIVT